MTLSNLAIFSVRLSVKGPLCNNSPFCNI